MGQLLEVVVLTLDRVFRRRFRPKQLGFTDDEQERGQWSDVINNLRRASRSRTEVCQTQEGIATVEEVLQPFVIQVTCRTHTVRKGVDESHNHPPARR